MGVVFGHPDLGGEVKQQAESAMFALDDVNSLLAVRGLLPAFTLP